MGAQMITTQSVDMNRAVTSGVDRNVPVSKHGSFVDRERKKERKNQLDAYQLWVKRLEEWDHSPNKDADPDFEFPSSEIIKRALMRLVVLIEQDALAPTNVCLDGDGGIVFELRGNTRSEFLHFWDDGSVEHFLESKGKIYR
jgi:hypothetical protein